MDESFKVALEPDGEGWRIALWGDIDVAADEAVRAALARALARTRSHVILDLSDAAFLDSTAINNLVLAHKAAQAASVRLIVQPGPPGVSLRVVASLLADTQARLESVQGLTGPERAQVIADFADELEGLRRVYERFHGPDDTLPPVADLMEESGTRLQGSWSDGEVV